MDKESFRQYGYQFVDWMVDYFAQIEALPVKLHLRPGEVRKKLPEKPPAQGESMDSVFKDFQDIILPGISHWQHPSWFAYFPANNSPPSILAEMLTAGIGAQCMVWQTSPAAAELEEVVMEWLRQMLGLPEGMAGVIQDTASTSTLVALLSARERATNFHANLKGIQNTLRVYASEETHSSIEKGVKIAGYGKENLRYIPTDDKFAMIPEKLEESIVEDKNKGFQPACVVGTVGTTSSTAVDPLASIGKICRRHDMWFHVDAAFSGTAAMLPEKKWMFEGVEYVDSFVFNPHKWMLTNFDCSAYFVKDSGTLIQTFAVHPEYLKTGVDAEVKNYRDWGIQLGRRFRALKLWFVIRYYGVKGLQKIVREHNRLAEMVKDWVKQDERFELMAPVPVSLVCFRLNDGRDEDQLNELNKEFLERLNRTGKLLLTQTSLRGKYVLRMSTAARLTEEKHVREAWELIRSTAGEVLS
ncbi:MAG: aminotransferase class V-fold PLP-dependent enzyme [Candidatus Aminicenantes bacterium]|nr:MAG: aminotransferase class V-fold PLP-dependent enzyme [Candidatus Aminicenantes bacterium]